MLNKEKYVKELVEIACSAKRLAVNKQTKKVCICSETRCTECMFYKEKDKDLDCTNERIKWANSEYVEIPKISPKDKLFLEYLSSKYKWMTRDKNGELCVFNSKPIKMDYKWKVIKKDTFISYLLLRDFNVSFSMVKWEDETPWLIDDLKGLEEE